MVALLILHIKSRKVADDRTRELKNCFFQNSLKVRETWIHRHPRRHGENGFELKEAHLHSSWRQ